MTFRLAKHTIVLTFMLKSHNLAHHVTFYQIIPFEINNCFYLKCPQFVDSYGLPSTASFNMEEKCDNPLYASIIQEDYVDNSQGKKQIKEDTYAEISCSAKPTYSSYDVLRNIATSSDNFMTLKYKLLLAIIIMSIVVLLVLILSLFGIYTQIHNSQFDTKISMSARLNSIQGDMNEQIKSINHTVDMLYTSWWNSFHGDIYEHVRMIMAEMGTTPALPASSCQQIYNLHPSAPSGFYWIRANNGSNIFTHCDLQYIVGFSRGWMRIAKLSKTTQGADCFKGLTHSSYDNRSCIPEVTGSTCSQLIFSSSTTYSNVRGVWRIYGVGSLNGFGSTPRSINEMYVDGVSITYGTQPNRKHIRTLAASSKPTCLPSWTFFGAYDYNCMRVEPLNATSCARSCHGKFNKQLNEFTTEDIEVRVCRRQERHNADIIMQEFELFVQ